MERILRDSKAAEVIPCSTELPVVFFPVRHHSPVCSWQLIRFMDMYQPDIVLIEGPVNANELIPVLTAEDTKLPAAFYCYYKDRKKFISPDAEDYKCYYPFQYSSPEYNAAVEAKKHGIPARFIDLPYSDILIAASGSDNCKQSYSDDSRLVRSRFYERICEKSGTRSFDEFWEKYFEIGGLFMSPVEFVRLMHTYCVLTRESSDESELIADGTLLREQFMAGNIAEAMKEHSRVLVVTGGFHCYGLFSLINRGNIPPVKLHSISAADQGCYPMAYSYEAADALRGYASGMRSPAFCDAVMDRLRNCSEPDGVYNDLTLELLIKTARETAKRDIPVSIADITAAQSLMKGLAALRGIRECGTAELHDAVTSCFIKGEKTVSTAIPLDILRKLSTGDSIGHIGDKSHVPPLIADFEKQCAALKLKNSRTLANKAEAALFSSDKGMELSRFMHRMEFLNTGFAEMVKGPDLHRNRDRSRIREEWKYKRSPSVDAALIDHTTDGFTIEEACTTFAAKQLRAQHRCENAAHIAVDCFLMGIPLEQSDRALIDEILSSDGDIFSVGKGLRSFETLHSLHALYGSEDPSSLLCLSRCFDKLISAMPSMADIPSDNAKDCISVLRTMFGLTVSTLPERAGVFRSALLTMREANSKEPSVHGAVMGLLYAIDPDERAGAEQAMRGYLRGSETIRKMGADYLRGLFATARDIMLADDAFLKMTDELVSGMEHDDFMEILPSLRLAFSFFTPSEIRTAAAAVSELHNSCRDDILRTAAVDEGLFLFGEELDREICKIIGKESFAYE